MSNKTIQRICPVENAGGLDNSFRRFLQNPKKILKPYIKEGMTVLDVGCGPGFFTLEIAKMLNNSGKVIAADLQQGMLDKIRQKLTGTRLESIIELHKCEETKLGITESIDFILAFWIIHEVPDDERLFDELKSILKSDGQILIIEPKFHVSKEKFKKMVTEIEALGFEVFERPIVFFSRSVLVSIKKSQS
jgi:ubiquinone/menaquinone biosynthesis C-methylase UbiE